MGRVLRTLTVVWLLVLAPNAASAEPFAFTEPLFFPQQARAQVDEQGQIVLSRSGLRVVTAIRHVRETRARTVVVDGKMQVVEQVVEVPVSEARTVWIVEEVRLPAKKVAMLDLDGKPVSFEKGASTLRKGATVLFSTRKVPSELLSIFRPDTLFLVVEPDQILPKIAAPATNGVAAAPLGTAVGLLRPAETRIPPLSANPQVSLARAEGEFLILRTQFTNRTPAEVKRQEPGKGDETPREPVAVQAESAFEREQRVSLSTVKASQANGLQVTTQELAKLLAAGRYVLVSTNGAQVDKSYLEIVFPETLIVVVPLSAQIEPKTSTPVWASPAIPVVPSP